MHLTLGLTLHRVGSRPDHCDIVRGEVSQPESSDMIVLLNAAGGSEGPTDQPDAVESWLESVMAELDAASEVTTH